LPLSFDFVAVQFLSGLASASDLFLVASGLSIIFGVTRIVNFAHGSFYMLGAYIAVTLIGPVAAGVADIFAGGPGGAAAGYWLALLSAAIVVALIGGLVETTVLRRIYKAPELFQLLATFAVVLIVQDLVLLIWGPEDRFGPRAPGLEGAVTMFGRSIPAFDLFLIALGPLVLAALTLLFRRTRFGILVRAATEDRDMVAALGVRRDRLFTLVFMLGSFLAGLGGALQVPHAPIHHAMDLQVIVEVFVVVVVGGLGSVAGAWLAAVLIGTLNAFGLVVFPEISLVIPFLVMASVLIVRPWGLLGRPQPLASSAAGLQERPIRPLSIGERNAAFGFGLAALVLPALIGSYALSVVTEILIFALFAVSLHLLTGLGGMVSFGHAAWFGLGAYGAALTVSRFGWPMEAALPAGVLVAALGAAVAGALCVRLTGVYLAMLTLAFAQIIWSIVFQWYDVTGGDNGILGVWPPAWAASPVAFYYLTLVLAGGSVVFLRQIVFSPFGLALRACRDSPLRADAVGIDRERVQRLAFVIAGGFAGLAGALYGFLKGSVFPDVLAVPLSVDALVMVLLGGIQSLGGPVVGAAVYKTLTIVLAAYTDYWRLVIGVVVLALVVAFPQGITGFLADVFGSRPADQPRTGGG
jgi:branched-chain amino acid transport system permease protein